MIANHGGGHWADLFAQNTNDVLIYTDATTDGVEIDSIEWRGQRKIISAHYDPAISWAAGQPRGADIYSHFHAEPEYGLLTLRTLKDSMRNSKKIFFPSETTRESYRSMLHLESPSWRQRTAVLPNASPSIGVSKIRRRKKSLSKNLGIVSRLDPNKLSIPLLIETLLLVRAKFPDVTVRIAGHGLLAEKVNSALQRNNMLSFVSLLGWVVNPSEVLDWSDVTFLPSHTESMPYAALESIASGIPVALPACGYFAERQENSSLVYTFDNSDPKSAAEAVTKAFDAPLVSQTGYNAFNVREWRCAVTEAYDLTTHLHTKSLTAKLDGSHLR